MPMKCCLCEDTKTQIVRLINQSFAALCTVHRQAHAAVIAEEQPDPAVCTKCGTPCTVCGWMAAPAASATCRNVDDYTTRPCHHEECIYCNPPS